ncbi:hypothetical protein [Methylomicrobium sp. Wu6]|uniref:hypothetical protein n=1 Tax=Methylomicrobium sp. Wu6 TaxID=3107928 RepID=UPI002DD63A6E|nr:hypothetical protein [Methylomicrobium sp. Wu6]MEC4750621.1 hypothetical protein [Methylomicrobium sp. Wu6]
MEVVKSLATCLLERGKDEPWEADGLYHQGWRDPVCGIRVDMAPEAQRQAKLLTSITISAPSKAKSGRGTGIGGETDLTKAYDAEKNAEKSQSGVQFVAGSIYGGLIFTIHQSRIEMIFLGAAAE